MSKRRITIQEYAKLVGVSKDTAYYWNKRGLIPLSHYKIGRQTWYIWEPEKVAGSLVSMNDKVRQELIKMREIFNSQVKRIDVLIRGLVKADMVQARRLVKK